MEPKFQTSFIPKTPVVPTQGKKSTIVQSTNFFAVVANVVFIVTLLVSGSLFLYKNILTGQVVEADQSLNDARAAFELDKINEIIDANARITTSGQLLEQHVVVSKLLLLLEQLTVKRVKIKELVYKQVGSNSIVLTMKNEAQTYNALAEQSMVFDESEFIDGVNYADFNPEENGNITANFSGSIDPTLVSYREAIESITINP